MLLSKSYFFGQLMIAQLSQSTVEATLNAMIAKYEPIFLDCVLEPTIVDEMMIAYNASIAAEDPVPLIPKWQKLLYGSAFVDSYGDSRRWNGLISDNDALVKQSPIANYVYYWYMRDNASQTVGNGEKKNKSENAVDANPNHKMCRAWNEMTDAVRVLREYMRINTVDFPTWVDPKNNWTRYKCKSLYSYIDANNVC
jgi:hypothetical protein